MIIKSDLIISPPIIAHRGASAYAPENTRASFAKTKQLSIKWLEFDIQLTADGEIVVFHDEDLQRTSNGKGKIIHHSLHYLQSLDIGGWFGPQFSEEKILTLNEVMLLLEKYNLSANIEVKAASGQESVIAEKLAVLLTQARFIFFLSSFSVDMLTALKKINSDFMLSFLMDEWRADWPTICENLNCFGVGINSQLLDIQKVQAIRATNRLVMAYTVNDPLEAAKLFSWGVNAVFSDCPDKILAGI